jgi:hypothetical protein
LIELIEVAVGNMTLYATNAQRYEMRIKRVRCILWWDVLDTKVELFPFDR